MHFLVFQLQTNAGGAASRCIVAGKMVAIAGMLGKFLSAYGGENARVCRDVLPCVGEHSRLQMQCVLFLGYYSKGRGRSN